MRNGSNIVLQDNIVEDMNPRDAMILFGNRDTIPSLSTAGNGLDKQCTVPDFTCSHDKKVNLENG